VPGSRDRPGQSCAAEPGVPESPQRLPPDVARDQNVMERADSLATSDNPPRWSRAELQQRLERLPVGHPSSPRLDPGEVEPPHRTAEPYRDREPEAERDEKADADKPGYWSELARFLKGAEEHKLRWPIERAATVVDRSRDPAGSWRGDGGQYLDAEQHAQAKEVIAMVKAREGKLTENLSAVDRDPSCTGRLVGLEHRLKGEDRLKEKIAEIHKRMPDRSIGDIVRDIPDAIRYTFCFELENYAAGYRQIVERMERSGYIMIYSKNHWRDDPEYKGINTRWVTEDGQLFEVQLHTAESLHAKQQVTHWAYERLRNPLTSADERCELRSFQREVCSWIPVPEGAEAIPDYYRKDRN
jgi:hypothetical protein